MLTDQRRRTLGRPGAANTDFSNAIRRVVSLLALSGRLQILVWLLLASEVAAIAIVRVGIALGRGSHFAAMTLTACASYAISPITWGHHLLFLGPMTLPRAGNGRSRRRVAAAAVAAVLVFDPGRTGGRLVHVLRPRDPLHRRGGVHAHRHS